MRRVDGNPNATSCTGSRISTCDDAQFTRLLRISFRSPKNVEVIADGTQPNGLTRRLMLSCDMRFDWAEQERLFGLAV